MRHAANSNKESTDLYCTNQRLVIKFCGFFQTGCCQYFQWSDLTWLWCGLQFIYRFWIEILPLCSIHCCMNDIFTVWLSLLSRCGQIYLFHGYFDDLSSSKRSSIRLSWTDRLGRLANSVTQNSIGIRCESINFRWSAVKFLFWECNLSIFVEKI